MSGQRTAVTAGGCGAPDQSAPLTADLAGQTVITGVVRADGSGEPVAGAYVRLLDRRGEFTAEVVSAADGQFRFFAAPGAWTVRALCRQGRGDAAVAAERGVNEVAVTVAE